MVRVSGLLEQVAPALACSAPTAARRSRPSTRSARGSLDLTAEQTRLWRDDLRPALAAEGIVIGTVDDLATTSSASSSASSSARSSRC